MKKQYLLLMIMCSLFEWFFFQTPAAIPYQAVVRNANGLIMANQSVTLSFTMHDSIATGNTVYQETHSLTTNTQGLVITNIGQGTSTIGSFSGIN